MEMSVVILIEQDLSSRRDDIEHNSVQYPWRGDVFRENVRVIRNKALPRQNVDQGVSHTAASHGRGVPNRSVVYDSGNYHDYLISSSSSGRWFHQEDRDGFFISLIIFCSYNLYRKNLERRARVPAAVWKSSRTSRTAMDRAVTDNTRTRSITWAAICPVGSRVCYPSQRWLPRRRHGTPILTPKHVTRARSLKDFPSKLRLTTSRTMVIRRMSSILATVITGIGSWVKSRFD